MAAVFKRTFIQDLTRPLVVRYCPEIVFSKDNLANEISVKLYNGTTAYFGGGSVSGTVIRADGSTVPIETGTISGNMITVTLVEACMEIPGPLQVYVKLTSGDVKTTVFAGVFTSIRTETDTVIDPGTVITGITDLINQIQEAIDSIPADYSALNNEIASVKNVITASVGSVSLGTHVFYNGILKDNSANTTKWFSNVATAPSSGDVYAVVYMAQNIVTDVPYYIRVIGNYADGTSDVLAYVTKINESFLVRRPLSKPVVDYSIVVNRSSGTTSEGVELDSSWGVILYSTAAQSLDNVVEIEHSDRILYNVAGAIGAVADRTVWHVDFVSSAVNAFNVRVIQADGRYGTPAHIARVLCTYTDGTSEEFYVDEVNTDVPVAADSSKTIESWSLALSVSSDSAQNTTTFWRVIAWVDGESEDDDTPEVTSWIPQIDHNVVSNTIYTQTGTEETVAYTETIPAVDGDLYALAYMADGVASDVPFYVRVIANCNDGTTYSYRLTALNTPFAIKKQLSKTVTGYTFEFKRSNGATLTETTCTWGVVLYTNRNQLIDNTVELTSTDDVIFNLSSAVDGSDSKAWFGDFIDPAVTSFKIQILDVAGQHGTPDTYGRVVCEYTDESADTIYLTALKTPVSIAASSEKTVSKWYLRLETSTDASVRTASTWRIVAWVPNEAKKAEHINEIEKRSAYLSSLGHKVIYNNILTHTGSQDDRWIEHVAVEQPEDVYALVYIAEGVESDIPFYARAIANFSDGSSYTVYLTALNTPFVIPKQAGKTITDYSVVLNRSDQSAQDSMVTSTCTWGIVLYTHNPTAADNAVTLSGDTVLFNLASAVDGSDTKVWFENIAPTSVHAFKIKIIAAEDRHGIPSSYGRVICEYSDGSADTTYLYNLGEEVSITASTSKTITKWYLRLEVSAEASVVTASRWRIIAWIPGDSSDDGDTPVDPSESVKDIAARAMNNLQVLNVDGEFFGPVSKDYVAQSTSERWQSASYANINDIPYNGQKYAYGIVSSRHGLGRRAGVLLFKDANGEYVAEGGDIFDIETDAGGSCVQRYIVPAGTVTIEANFEGISNTQSDQTCVVGETYYVRDCVVILTDADIEDLRDPLDSQYKAAIATLRNQAGTSLCFAIQTDTHVFANTPQTVGRRLPLMSQHVGFDFVANLGDITRGYNEDSRELMREYAVSVMRQYTKDVRCPFLLAVGNHEKNILYAGDNDGIVFTQDEIYSMYTRQVLNTSDKIVPVPGKSYYYLDLPTVRVIVLFTNDSEEFAWKISDEQNAWLANTALNTTKPVLVLAHVPIVTGLDDATSTTYTTALNAIESFSNNGGTVIACIYGHTHNQQSLKQNGIWHITCDDSYTYNSKHAEFFMVNLTTYDISTIGIGVESRTFTH